MKYTLPLDGRSYLQKIEEAKKLLLENGYLVRGPLLKKNNVKSTKDLVTFFYDTLTIYRSNSKIGYRNDKIKDLTIAKKFIDSRLQTGIGKERALLECCLLIEILFKYEHLIGLSEPISSMSVLGQDNMSWVTEKLILIYNGLNVEACREEDELWYESFRNRQEKNISNKSLLDKKFELDRMLEEYGKKEARSRS